MNWYKRASFADRDRYNYDTVVRPADSDRVYRRINLFGLYESLKEMMREEIARMIDEEDKNSERYEIIDSAFWVKHIVGVHFLDRHGKDNDGGAYTGTIIIRCNRDMDADIASEIMQKWAEHYQMIDDFRIIVKKVDYWSVTSSGEWNIEIHENPSQGLDEIPEMKLMRNEWIPLYSVLFPEREVNASPTRAAFIPMGDSIKNVGWIYGSVGVNDLERRVGIAEGIIDTGAFGVRSSSIKKLLPRLQEMVDYCKRHGVNSVTWGH